VSRFDTKFDEMLSQLLNCFKLNTCFTAIRFNGTGFANVNIKSLNCSLSATVNFQVLFLLTGGQTTNLEIRGA